MKRFWFQLTLCICLGASLFGMLMAAPDTQSVFAQAAATDTPVVGGTPFVTNTFQGEPAIYVRTGPSTISYPICGSIPLGQTAPAIGESPGHEWIQIVFASCPGGVGWTYAANVQLSPAFAVKVVEPPDTPAPLATATIDLTLAAAFSVQPTETRLPTFTPAPPLVIPKYSDDGAQAGHFPLGTIILVVAGIGAAVLGVSFFGRR